MHVVRWWPFIDGRYLMRGIDLIELAEACDAERFMNIIDAIFVEDALSGADIDGGIEKLRTKIMSVYNDSKQYGSSNDEDGGYYPRETQPIVWTEQTDEGYIGLEPPLSLG